MLPSLFISHGSPDMRLRDHELRDFLSSLGSKIGKAKSIIIVSAHWYTPNLEILTNSNPQIIYDFYGFAKELYEVKYTMENDLNLVDQIVKKLLTNKIDITKNSIREGYDHGVWSILSLMYPKLDIPVVQISLPISYSTLDLLKLGEVLKEFREDSLIIGSGGMTHNLRDINPPNDNSIKPYVKKFRDYVIENLDKTTINKLVDLKDIPYLRQNHPTLEHLLPLYVNIGSSVDKKGKSMIESYMFGTLALDTIVFNS